MSATKAYDEIVDFIARNTPQAVIDFRPSEETRTRVFDLIAREKKDGLEPDEKVELDHYMEIEHIMRLAKAKAHLYLTREQP